MVGVCEYFFWSCCGAPACVRTSQKLKIATGNVRTSGSVRGNLMKLLFAMLVRLIKPQSRYRGDDESFGSRSQKILRFAGPNSVQEFRCRTTFRVSLAEAHGNGPRMSCD